MAISVVDMVEVARVMAEIKGGKISKWVSQENHEDIEVIDENGNRYVVEFHPATTQK